MWNDKCVSVILPALNEELNIKSVINDFFDTGVVDEVIVVDNGSMDNTKKVVQSTEADLVEEEREGFGFALRKGLEEVDGEYIITSESDGTFNAGDVEKLLCFGRSFKLVLGTRTNSNYISSEANMGFLLRIGNIIIAKLLQTLYHTPSLSDCGCTMRLIKKEALMKMKSSFKVGGAHFLPEMVILAQKFGFPFVEVPVYYNKRKGKSKITGSWKGILQTGIKMIFLILNYKIQEIRS